MSDIYVFSSNEDGNDYATMGMVGALVPSKCIFRETTNGESILEMEHPLDSFGRYTALEKGNIIVAPVPVRTTPEIQNGSCVTTVWSYKVKPLNQLTSKKQRTLYKKSRGGGRKKIMNAGDVMTVVQMPEGTNPRWKVKTKYGTGWIDPNGAELVTEHVIEDNSHAIEEVQSPWTVMDQYFRIYEVTKGLNGITVSARHISYDLLYEVSSYNEGLENAVDLKTAIDGILSNTYGFQDKFHGYTNVNNAKAGLHWRGKNVIDCFLDPEEGVCAQYDVGLVRDNYDLYFLHDPGMNRGVRIQYGKNMTGVRFTSSDDEIATRIIPIGEKKNGEELFLSNNVEEQCVDSPRINDYPIKHVYYLKCDNCKVGDKDENGGTITTNVARARMRAQAQKLIDEGADEPKITLEVEYVDLGDTEEYQQFKNLENLFLFDYAIVQHPDLDIDVTAQVTGIEWNVLTDRMEKTTIGSVGLTMANSGITSWQIPAGFSGSKIAGGTIGSAALKTDVVSARHLQADSVNTSALQAACVTALKIAAGAITADKLDVDTVDAKIANVALANLTTANMQHAVIDWAQINALAADIATISKAHLGDADIKWAQITKLAAAISTIAKAEIENAVITTAQIDRLSAAVADIVHEQVGVGEFSLAEIKNLLANALILEQGNAGMMTIKNLIVTNANLLNVTIQKLVMPGEDGKYYEIMIGTDGTVRTQEVTVTAEEINAGETVDGRQIVATTINATAIHGSTVTAQQGVFNTILTSALTAGKITAGEALVASATIPTLFVTAVEALGNTMTFSANESIQMIVGNVEAATFHDSDMPPAAAPIEGKKWLDRGVTPPIIRRWRGAEVPTEREYAQTATGNPVVLDNTPGHIEHIAPMVTVAATETGSGEKSPSNPYTINGVTGASAYLFGKNLLPPQPALTKNGVTITPTADGGIHISGTCTEPSGSPIMFAVPINLMMTGQYTFSMGNRVAVGTHLQMRLYDPNGMPIYTPNTNVVANVVDSHRSFILDRQQVWRWIIRVGGGETYDITIYPQLEANATATTCVEHQNGGVLTCSFGTTVYGARVDWAAGKWYETHGYIAAYAGETVPDGWISGTGELTVGTQVVYPLAAEIEHDIGTEILSALAGVNTVLTEDVMTVTYSGSGWETINDVEYIKDTANAAMDAAESLSNDLGNTNERIDSVASRIMTPAQVITTVEASSGYERIRAQTELNADGLSVIRSQTIPGLAGRVEVIESGVHIGDEGIGIWQEGSSFRNTITHLGFVVTQDGTPVITCAESKITAPRLRILDAFIIGKSALKPGADNHLRLLKYGR